MKKKISRHAHTLMNPYYKCWVVRDHFQKMNLVKNELVKGLNNDILDSLMVISINEPDEIKNFDQIQLLWNGNLGNKEDLQVNYVIYTMIFIRGF